MLNEDKVSTPEVKLNESDSMTNIYYNDLRRAEISQINDSEFSIKLNSVTGGNGTLQTTDLDTAKEWSQIYVKSGKIPSKQNSQFKQLQNTNGNIMTEEEFIAPETDVSETVQKLNADFEHKLNERDAKIAELDTQLGDLVQKQNEAEEALVAERAKQDFELIS